METSSDHTSSAPQSGVATPTTHHVPKVVLHNTPKSLRPYVYAVMAFKKGHKFQRRGSVDEKNRISQIVQNEGKFAAVLKTSFVGIAAAFNHKSAVVAIAVHDSTYLLDFSVQTIEWEKSGDSGDKIADYIVRELERYERENLTKFIGAGMPLDLAKRSPLLSSRLWLELDIVPISIRPHWNEDFEEDDHYWSSKCVDEQADSMARKCIMYFGPGNSPMLQVAYRGVVEVDSGSHATILSLADYQGTCAPTTWNAMMKFVISLKEKETKIAFFSSTPQGGGVALMRHALVRLAKLLKVDLAWYVPKPRPGVFRITKNIHNILQGVSKPHENISDEDKQVIIDWIEYNAQRYWLSPGGPLRPASEGGADVIMIDDPQMPGLIPMIKKLTPERPVLYRSHIQIRSDLVNTPGTPQADVWQFLWGNIKHADMFISHPIPAFVPESVPREKVCYLPATTDWLDGLNKDMSDWDQAYYGHLYNEQCHALRMTELRWPYKKYIIQIARFDPAKGIPDVIESYAEFRRLLAKHSPLAEAPQLVICGNGSVDDPDGTRIYDETLFQLQTSYPSLIPSISVMRLSPNDQLLNTLLSSSHTVLQLSTREGFEVKVSEALHKGKPVIATKRGGIPLQIQDGKNGFLVEAGDINGVAEKLLELWTDEERYREMSSFAKRSVSDEVGTVGNALSWFYLADVWHGGSVRPEGRWVNDLAREEAGVGYEVGENRLPRF